MFAYFYIHPVVHHFSGFYICELACIVKVLGKLKHFPWCLCGHLQVFTEWCRTRGSIHCPWGHSGCALPCLVFDTINCHFYDWHKAVLFASFYFLLVTLSFKMSLSGVLKSCLLFLSTRKWWMLEQIYMLSKLYSTMNCIVLLATNLMSMSQQLGLNKVLWGKHTWKKALNQLVDELL